MMKMLPLNQPQFFFDDEWIASSRRVTRRWLAAEVNPDPVLVADKPWEGPAIVLYGTVLPAPGGGWRMYYSNFAPEVTFGKPGDSQPFLPCTMLAESEDGLRWHKPELNVGPSAVGPTNIVYCPGSHWDSPSLMHDPADPAAPYKMISFGYDMLKGGWDNPRFGLYTLTSEDGLNWTPTRDDGLRNLQAGDRTNLLGDRVDDEYWIYTRHKDQAAMTGGRAIFLSRSSDFVEWTEPELVLAPDLTDEPDVEFYGMPVFRRHGWFIGLLEYWRGDTDVFEVHLAISRDGRTWHRPLPHTPFIGPAYPWNSKWSTCAGNGPIILNEQMVFYFGGRNVSHGWGTAKLHGVIGYASMAVDRFCCVESGNYGGSFTTPPMTWPGGDLALNADTREAFDSHPAHCNGEIAVEVLAPDGQPLEEWSDDRKAVFRGNTHCRGQVFSGTVRWPDDRSLSALNGQAIRLRFHLRHSRLFTVQAIADAATGRQA